MNIDSLQKLKRKLTAEKGAKAQEDTYNVYKALDKDAGMLKPLWEVEELEEGEQIELKRQIKRIVLVESNFLAPPTMAYTFSLSSPQDFLKCRSAITHDTNLEKSRAFLVPEKISEVDYWRNYLFRVDFVKKKFMEGRKSEVPITEELPKKEEVAIVENSEDGEDGDEDDLSTVAEEFEKLSREFDGIDDI